MCRARMGCDEAVPEVGSRYVDGYLRTAGRARATVARTADCAARRRLDLRALCSMLSKRTSSK